MNVSFSQKYYWKRLIRSLLAYVKFLLSPHSSPKPLNSPNPNLFLLVRLDEIGDYILWRNFIPVLNQAWPEKKMILCGNIAWKPLWESLDANYASDCIWINKTKWLRDADYRSEIIQKVRQYQPELTINLTYSRSFNFDDHIVRFVNSPQRVGVQGDLSSNFSWQDRISQKWYTRLLVPPQGIRFDFERNHWLVKTLTTKDIKLDRPKISWKPTVEATGLPIFGTYFVIFPAGRQSYKRWSATNFAIVAEKLAACTGLRIVIAGGPSEEIYAEAVLKHLQSHKQAVNLAGKTSLPQLMTLLQGAALLISNDTSSVHIAAALGTPTIALLNGTHYGRFCPYPIENKPILQSIYPPKLLQDGLTEPERWQKYQYRVAFDINSILPEIVLERACTLGVTTPESN